MAGSRRTTSPSLPYDAPHLQAELLKNSAIATFARSIF
jgi:hypothetical protein